MPDAELTQLLGTICLLADDNPTHTGAKVVYGGGITALDALRRADPDGEPRATGGSTPPVTPGSEDAFYMLAAYCFDLQRKMEYLYLVTRPYGESGDPDAAEERLADQLYINEPGLSWKQRAFRAEARMLELRRRIGDDHRELLRRVAKRAGEAKADNPGPAADG